MQRYLHHVPLLMVAGGRLAACNTEDPTAAAIDDEVPAVVVEGAAPPSV